MDISLHVGTACASALSTECVLFICPHLPKAGMGHIAFRRDVMSVRAYVCMCVCHVRNQVQVFVPASLGAILRPRFSCSL